MDDLSPFYEFVSAYLTPERKSLFEKLSVLRTRYISVVLEDIFQSHNASAVLRSCDCFGIQDVHIIENRNEWNHHPHVERGSSRWLSIHRYGGAVDNTVACLTALKAKGYQIAATSPHAALGIDEISLERPTALVFGTEMQGISDRVVGMADVLCKIPMYGFTESFNISVAAAVTLHAMRRRIEEENRPWQLNESERISVMLDWCSVTLKHYDKYRTVFDQLQRSKH